VPVVRGSGWRMQEAIDYQQLLKHVVALTREAGVKLSQEACQPGGPRGERSKAPIDLEVEWKLRDGLLSLLNCSYLGEETAEEPIVRDDPHLWIVDPHDGTRAFLQGHRGSAVAISLVRQGIPVLGVVYAFSYPDSDGDLIAWAEGGPLLRNGSEIEPVVRTGPLTRDDLIALSPSAATRPEANARCAAPARFLCVPSLAYRMALVAVGDVRAATSLGSPAPWDVAAGHALLRGAGCVCVDEDGQDMVYECRPKPMGRLVFAGDADAVRALRTRPWRDVLGTAPTTPRLPASVMRRRSTRQDWLTRAQGCLLGQLAGDALGSLVEFKSADEISHRYPQGVRDLADGGTHNTIAGQPTDDSEMALALARSIALHGRYDPWAALEAYVQWHRSDPFDIGRTTRLALSIGEKALAQKTGVPPTPWISEQSQANGGLMRVSPLGILYAGDPEAGARAAAADTALTHPHPICQSASAAYVAAIAVLIAGGNVEEAWQAAMQGARTVADGADLICTRLERARQEPPDEFLYQQGWVLIAFQNAFYWLLQGADLETAVIATVGSGGDTDTNGAIAGALLGAAQGRRAIPWRWQRLILTCRPLASIGARRPRPPAYWPDDALALAEAVLAAA